MNPLPIDSLIPEIVATLAAHSALVLQAPTGTGKTTRVPPALLNSVAGQIIVLEPRRLAARAAARRMASERGERLGDRIGYQVRFEWQAGPQTRLLVVTPGILLRRLQDDPFLESVGALVFDEFHERSLDNDLALGLARLLQQTVRPELRLVVMSATLDTGRVAEFLGGCPVLTSAGRLHPVTVRYEPRSLQDSWPEAAARATQEVLATDDGDVLVFLPGMGEIRQTARLLEPTARRLDLDVLPLHGDLPAEEQDRALLPQARRRVVLATNVAETSVTVEGITAVIDTGLARQQRFNPSVGMDRLEVVPIARDAADQRAGRAGRTRPGVCIRLWSEASHRQRAESTAPEIRRVDLAGAVPQLLAAGERDPARFPWLEAPAPESIDHALELLRDLGAVMDRTLTELGQRLAELPVHPRLGRLLVEGQRQGASRRAALAAALLAERDPFLRGSARGGRGGSVSDVLDRVEALERFETGGDVGDPNIGAARFVLRARDQLLRILGNTASSRSSTGDEALLRSLLAAFPDRVARRREPGSPRGVMVGGRGVKLAPSSGVREGALFLCIEVDGAGTEALVRQASLVEREWLDPALCAAKIEVGFDAESERVAARKVLRYLDLVLEESVAALPEPEETGRVLAEAAARHMDRVLPAADSPASGYLRRLRCLRDWLPELGLPAFDETEVRALLPELCAGCRSFEELRHADWRAALESRLTYEQQRAVEREAPERIEVPSGSRIALQYEEGRPPVLAVKIQEMFGLAETPRVAGGRVRVLLHLLAPNGRPQQVTDDLAGFWERTYPIVRKELRARYPRHAWPEDPLQAPAQRRPSARRK